MTTTIIIIIIIIIITTYGINNDNKINKSHNIFIFTLKYHFSAT